MSSSSDTIASENSDNEVAAKHSNYTVKEVEKLRIFCGEHDMLLVLCENTHGIFLSLIKDGTKLHIPGSGIGKLRLDIYELRARFEEYTSKLSTEKKATIGQIIGSCSFISEEKRFYLDLIAGVQNTFVKITKVTKFRLSISFLAPSLYYISNALTCMSDVYERTSAVTSKPARNYQPHVEAPCTKISHDTNVFRVIKEKRINVVLDSSLHPQEGFLTISKSEMTSKSSVAIPNSMIPRMIEALKEIRTALIAVGALGNNQIP